MGADIYESYVSALISTCVVAAVPNPAIDIKGIMLSFLIAVWGIISLPYMVCKYRFFLRAPFSGLAGGMITDFATQFYTSGRRNGLIAESAK